MRGDRPYLNRQGFFEHGFTPHARGSTVVACSVVYRIRVYPACAGIDPFGESFRGSKRSLPRMRGDRPRNSTVLRLHRLFTPHARGSTMEGRWSYYINRVYPACAGIDLSPASHLYASICLPRMRGDRPYKLICYGCGKAFTPHARGSTRCEEYVVDCTQVYPACAGIDPRVYLFRLYAPGLPRMRGERPYTAH